MTLNMLTEFFMWCSILNCGCLIYITVFCIWAPDWLYRVQCTFFSISREQFDLMIYAFIGLFKLCFIVFCLVPYLALLIIR
jgi:hypothetical protein